MADVELEAFDAAVTDWELRPLLREDVTDLTTHTHQPRDRRSRRRGARRPPRPRPTPRSSARTTPSRPGATWRPASARGCCARSPRSSTTHNEELARLEVENSGHTIGNARWEAGNVRDVLNYYSAAPERLVGKQIPVAGGVDITFHEPLGVVGVIVPWNFPMPIAGWGFAPALAAGNTVVLKPAEITPADRDPDRRARARGRASRPGVFTVVPGKGSVVGKRFVTHPLVRKVVFTGSTEVGKQIMAGCAEQVKQVTLELGGKSANIVFADADVAAAAAARRAPSSTTPARTAAPARGSWSSVRRTTSSSAAWRRPCAGCGCSTRRRGQRDGAAGLGRAARRRAAATSTTPRSRSRGATPDGAGLLAARRRSSTADDPRDRSGARRCSARSSR